MAKYQHYKGGIYKLLSTYVYHTETNERLAVYENSEGKVFARPYDMFFEKVEVDGVMVERFKEIKPICTEFRQCGDSGKSDENTIINLLKKFGRNG